ncbi:PREDICTED: interactor of constitutive active ROPs 5 isoform X2 [Camelina sativa]|uniref:Interactor of constitutive active ROPs 5 isoform X1 n=1 Tax=Camelina sativa TaxID=90675 RepID=A0ABM1QET3_CAMSA|nr:PREDICTED: interactor of constitutive active ROPs 5 isoform X1 [Camelina sativa]XP_019085271.1 PREDICTED: interactor of constitutive active ROPs 5 isoform X2 [Camelina sativa]
MFLEFLICFNVIMCDRPGSLELPHKKTPLPAPKVARRLKPSGAESDLKTKTISKTQIPKAVADRRSPRIPLNEIQKKRTGGKIPELESQISQLQEELKKAKEELNRSEALKREAQEEAEDAKHQLMEINASEDSRIEELRKLSQERDKTWQSELEAMQRQHGMDSSALSSAINEVQKLKSKLFESESELEQSRFEARSLEKLVRQLEEERANSIDSSSSMEVEELKEAMNLARNEISQLKSAVEAAEIRYQEEYIQSTLQIRNAYEQTETVKSRYSLREAELTEELNRTKGEIEDLREQLIDKKKEDDLTDTMKKLESDLMEVRGSLMDKEMELQILKSAMEKKVETANTEAVEAELKRVKVQCEQWRKAAETAASILNNNDEERTDSIETSKMLKKFGVLLKKNHK